MAGWDHTKAQVVLCQSDSSPNLSNPSVQISVHDTCTKMCCHRRAICPQREQNIFERHRNHAGIVNDTRALRQGCSNSSNLWGKRATRGQMRIIES